MAKKIKNKKQRPSRTVVRVGGPTRGALDSAALAYAKLIADPCNAPIVHPVYSGTEGGYLFRAESFFSVGTAGGHTSGVVSYTPGAIGNTNNELCGFGSTSPTTSVTPVDLSGVPGKAFLQSNASVVRCVAACMKVTYNGSESSRSGRIHYGHGSGALVPNGVPTTVDAVAQALPNYTRTPPQEIELVWKPNDADQLTRDPNQSQAAQDLERRAALVVAFAGLPPDAGLTFRLTTVWEWQPEVNKGISVPNLSKSPSSNTLDDVVNHLIKGGFRFIRHAGMSLLGGAGLPGAIIDGVSNVFGLMPSRNNTRTARIMGV